jgi:RimJ/RimL family protein N-acetyltransferase
MIRPGAPQKSPTDGASGMCGISFRPFEMADIPTLMSWAASADELLQWAGPNFSFPLDENQLRAYAEGASDSRHLISGVHESGEVVAHAELNLLPQHRLGQVRRVAVAPRARGRGIGRALMTRVLQLGFDELALHRIELVVFSFNEPARRCYGAIGFKEEGRAREARVATSGYWDLIHMALLEESYHRQRALDD